MNARVTWLVARLRQHGATLAISGAAAALAWAFVVAVWQHARQFGLPLEDAYIYLTYAKQFGRAEPFTYFHGGGYSAGSTSVLWPMVPTSTTAPDAGTPVVLSTGAVPVTRSTSARRSRATRTTPM